MLSLFVEIPNHHVVALAMKCEKFQNSFNEEHTDDIDSDEGDMKVDDSDITQMGGSKRGGHKSPRNSSQSNRKFFIKFGVAVVVVEAYFFALYILSNQFISNISIITNEMSVAAQAESYFSLAQNVQREMIYNHEKPVFG